MSNASPGAGLEREVNDLVDSYYFAVESVSYIS